MKQIQIIEDESLTEFADFENCEIWLLNRTSDCELDTRVINCQELTESMLPIAAKIPQLLTLLYERYPSKPLYQTNETGDEVIGYEQKFDYEVLTRNKNNYIVKSFICDENRIKTIF
ncbi:MAG: hypothetical protein UHO11_02250 [Treponema sp.]|nr:hypothetical protein [Treponema sp.]